MLLYYLFVQSKTYKYKYKFGEIQAIEKGRGLKEYWAKSVDANTAQNR